MVGLHKGDLTFESMFCIQVHLLRLRYLLQNILDHNAIIYANITEKRVFSSLMIGEFQCELTSA